MLCDNEDILFSSLIILVSYLNSIQINIIVFKVISNNNDIITNLIGKNLYTFLFFVTVLRNKIVFTLERNVRFTDVIDTKKCSSFICQ